MTKNSANSSSTNDLPRCQHRFRSGHQCRLAVSDTASDLCTKHARARQKQSESPGLAAVLTADIGEFKSAYDVHDFLSRLQQLLAEKRISPRHAGVMAYISSLHLRTLAAIDRETNGDDAPVQVILDIPRPIRDEHPTRCASPACPGLSRSDREPLGESDRDEPHKPS